MNNNFPKKKVVAIVQARMDSSRLPGKVLKEILDKSLLEYLIERIEKSTLLDEIIIATSHKSCDDIIQKFCNEKYIKCFRGSENDVLSRFYEAATESKADYIIRICADSPVIDFSLIDELISEFTEKSHNCDYLSNTINQTYPLGMNVEIFTSQALKKAYINAKTLYEREHVTPYIYSHPKQFSIGQKHLDKDMSFLRLTVDEQKDFELIKYIIEELYPTNPNYTLSDILNLYDKNPEIFKINSNVKQTFSS